MIQVSAVCRVPRWLRPLMRVYVFWLFIKSRFATVDFDAKAEQFARFAVRHIVIDVHEMS